MLTVNAIKTDGGLFRQHMIQGPVSIPKFDRESHRVCSPQVFNSGILTAVDSKGDLETGFQ